VRPDGDNYVVDGDFTLKGVTRPISLIVEFNGVNPETSSSAPSRAGSRSVNSAAPGPHASQSTVPGALGLSRAVTAPLRIRLVRQIAPSAASW
ncbi:YceI family protein, partial [Mycobacterium sp. NAZ190054]|uniref:YceI family protein n=1 Tax=Mycobacterium sp. NAZ190054 TaxID=1747766 RepID=UPI001E55D6E0